MEELEDTEGISESAVAEATDTTGPGHLAKEVASLVARLGAASLEEHALCRKGGHHYYRARMKGPSGEEILRYFRVDWVQP